MLIFSVKRLELVNFLSVIQLVTALNFANISSKLHYTMFKSIIDVDAFFKLRFGGLQQKMAVDLESLKSMSPLQTTDGKSNKSKIETLKQKYFNFSVKWDSEKQRVASLMDDFRGRKGMNSMFLYLSLYCIFDMLFIGYNSNTAIEKNEFWFGSYTLLSAMFLLFYFVLMLLKKTDNISSGTLYIGVSGVSLGSLFLAYWMFPLNLFITNYFCLLDLEDFLCYSDSLAVFLPYQGFVLCLVFIICNWLIILWQTRKSIQSLEKEHEKMHREKVVIDEMYDSFKSDDMQFG